MQLRTNRRNGRHIHRELPLVPIARVPNLIGVLRPIGHRKCKNSRQNPRQGPEHRSGQYALFQQICHNNNGRQDNEHLLIDEKGVHIVAGLPLVNLVLASRQTSVKDPQFLVPLNIIRGVL